MAKKTLTSGLLGTVTGLSKEAESVSTNSAVAPVEMPKEVAPEIPGQSDKRRPGRPSANSGEPEICVTFKLPDSLAQEIKMLAVVERTTQKEIITAALKEYVSQRSK